MSEERFALLQEIKVKEKELRTEQKKYAAWNSFSPTCLIQRCSEVWID